MTALWNGETCLAVGKRRPVIALQKSGLKRDGPVFFSSAPVKVAGDERKIMAQRDQRDAGPNWRDRESREAPVPPKEDCAKGEVKITPNQSESHQIIPNQSKSNLFFLSHGGVQRHTGVAPHPGPLPVWRGEGVAHCAPVRRSPREGGSTQLWGHGSRGLSPHQRGSLISWKFA
jgi:hypothetical protein